MPLMVFGLHLVVQILILVARLYYVMYILYYVDAYVLWRHL